MQRIGDGPTLRVEHGRLQHHEHARFQHRSTGGLRPAGPPIALARGDPGAPRSALARAPAARLVFTAGFPLPDPPSPSLAGTPAPRSALARAPAARLVFTAGFPPPDPHRPRSRGP